MKIRDIVERLGAKVIAGDIYLEREVEFAFASDLMSDVLTLDNANMLLITGLSNMQAIRTAEMSDISTLIFARNKKITEEMKKVAAENDMVLIESPYSVFRISGELFSAGINPVY